MRFPQGIPMHDGTTTATYPYPEGSPNKPDWIALDQVAVDEWDRICTALAARRALSPAWGGLIAVTAATFSSLMRLTAASLGPGGIDGGAELVGCLRSAYRSYCVECQVEVHRSMKLRDVSFDVMNREE